MRRFSYFVPTVGLVLAGLLAGCTTTDPATRKQKVSHTTEGAVAGAVGGVLVGGLLCAANNGHRCGEIMAITTAAGAIDGAAKGAGADAYEAKLLAEFEMAGVQIAERGGNAVLETRSAILFAKDDDRPTGSALRQLRTIGKILARYPGHAIDIVGHTSSDEDAAVGIGRAEAAGAILASRGVGDGRMATRSVGASQPLRAEDTESGRAANRTVEIFLRPRT